MATPPKRDARFENLIVLDVQSGRGRDDANA